MIREISGESVKSAIALKLKSGYAEQIGSPPLTVEPTIYKEAMVQKIRTPCFFIWTMNITQRQTGRNRYRRNYQMNIRYHPQDNVPTSYEQLTRIGSMALEILRELTLPVFTSPELGGARVKGTELSYKLVENVLQIFVTYSFDGKFTEPEYPDMQTLIQNREVIGG